MRTGFGWVEVRGRRYDHDIVIHTDGSVSKREKNLSRPLSGDYGHTPLSTSELGFLADERPEVVYVGTGQHGELRLTPGAMAILGNFRTVILPTGELLPLIERERRPFAAIVHITC